MILWICFTLIFLENFFEVFFHPRDSEELDSKHGDCYKNCYCKIDEIY